jgi:hypothetical protein
VGGVHLLVGVGVGDLLGLLQGLLRFDGQAIGLHGL